jgi:serine/threonine protein kinase
VVDAPKDQQGLVLPLVDCCPSAYQILGNPPSFATCTRDTFPIGTSFSYTTILGVLQSVASACAHLHSPSGKRRRGIMHGDLYAHNILLHRGLNHVLLTDFGAASFKPHFSRSDEPTSPSRINFDGVRSSAAELSLRLEQLEVRAFGCLVDDMLTFADPSTVLTVGLRTARSRSASLHASEGDSSMRITPPSDIVIVRPPVADSVPAAEQTQLIDTQGPGLDPAKAAMELLHLGMPQDIKTLLDALRTVCCNPVVKERPTFDVICQLLSHFESL